MTTLSSFLVYNMEEVLKVSMISIISVILALILVEKSPFFSIFIVIAVGIIILTRCFFLLQAVFENINQLILQTGISTELFQPVIKVCAIAIIVKISGDICKDAGFSAVAQKIQLAGSISSIIAVFPLFLKIFDLLQGIL